MEKIIPQVVTTDTDGYKGIDYSKLTPVLAEAIKEQQLMIQKLASMNDHLQVEMKLMKKEIESIKDLTGSKLTAQAH